MRCCRSWGISRMMGPNSAAMVCSLCCKRTITTKCNREAERVWSMVNDICLILTTQSQTQPQTQPPAPTEQWEYSLHRRLSSDLELKLINYVHVILVLKRLHDAKLSLVFFNWVGRQPNFSYHPHLYSAMLKILAEAKMFPDAEHILETMKAQGSIPTRVAVSCLLAAYSQADLTNKALDMFAYARTEGLWPSLFACNTLMDSLVKRNNTDIALTIYAQMPLTDEYSKGIVIRGLCREGRVSQARAIVGRNTNTAANVVFYNTLMDGYCSLGQVGRALGLLGEMVKFGICPNGVSYGTLINGLCKEGSINEAQKLLNLMLEEGLRPKEFVYNELIHGYCKQGNLAQAYDLLIELLEKGHSPDVVTYGVLVHGLCLSDKVGQALCLKDQMVKYGLQLDIIAYNALISGLCKQGSLEDANKLMTEMLEKGFLPDDFSYVTLVDGYCSEGQLSEAIQIFNLMLEKGIEPGLVGYNAMIKGYGKLGMMGDACSCVAHMLKRQLLPDEFTFTTLIDAYCKQHNTSKAMNLFSEMLKWNCNPDVVTYTALINGYCKEEEMQKAWALYQEMQERGFVPNEVTYSTLINGYCKSGNIVEAILVFDAMLQKACMPNEVTYKILIAGLCKASRMWPVHLKRSMWTKLPGIFHQMLHDGWDHKMATYNTLIVGLCVRKKLQQAIKLKDKMSAEGFYPDGVTYAGLLHGLCQEDKVNDVDRILSEGLGEDMLHVALRYSILIDLYYNEGNASKATLILRGQNIIQNIQARDDATVGME